MSNNVFDNDLILPLKSLIFDKQYICRGYITYSGQATEKRLCNIPELYEKYKANILKSKWILSDPKSANIVKYNNKYTFIDYDSIYPLKNVIKTNNKLFLKFSNKNNEICLFKIRPEFHNKYLLENHFPNISSA